jgi:hypothetical protein
MIYFRNLMILKITMMNMKMTNIFIHKIYKIPIKNYLIKNLKVRYKNKNMNKRTNILKKVNLPH